MHYDSLVAWTLLGVALTLWLIGKVNKMSASLDRITREVSESRQATESVLTLVSGLSDQIRDLKDDPAALEQLADDLDAQQGEIASAVTANTPAEAPAPAETGAGETAPAETGMGESMPVEEAPASDTGTGAGEAAPGTEVGDGS